MRVLYVSHTQDMSGANRSMMQMILELRAQYQVEPFVVMPRIQMDTDYTLESVCRAQGIPCIVHKMTRFKRHEGCGLIECMYFICLHILTTAHLLWLLRGQRFDLVHSNSSVCDTGAYIAWWKHVPHVWHLREFGQSDFGLVSCLGHGYERWIYRHATVFLAISKVIKEAFLTVIPSEKIRVVYNGICLPDSHMLAVHESSIINIALVGRIEKNKNQLEALEAIRLLVERDITNFHLTIIGRSREGYDEILNAYIREHSLSEYVTLLGFRTDVPQLMQGMDIGLMLSTSEAFGRVTVEYQLQDLAVVATDAGANAELIQNGVTGLLYSLGHPEQLADCLQRMITNHDLLLNIAHQGRIYAEANFLSTRNSAQVYDVYDSVMRR